MEKWFAQSCAVIDVDIITFINPIKRSPYYRSILLPTYTHADVYVVVHLKQLGESDYFGIKQYGVID